MTTPRQLFANLRKILGELYPDESSARRVVSDAGLSMPRIAFSSQASNNWYAILSEAEKSGQVNALLSVVLAEYGGNLALQAAAEAYREAVESATEINTPTSLTSRHSADQTTETNTPAPSASTFSSDETELNFSGRKLRTVPGDLLRKTNLVRLDLSQNQLTTVPRQLGQLHRLTWLNLSTNQLAEWPQVLLELQQLSELYLSNNQISHLPDNIVALTNLTRLYLASNRLIRIPPDLASLPRLAELDLADNKLTALPDNIGQLANLTNLVLRGNQLNRLGAIVDLHALTVLDLVSNRLDTLPPTIGGLTNLQVLKLRDNKLTTLPGELAQLHKLTRLELQYNSLRTFPAFLTTFEALTWLELAGNQLNSLPPEFGRLTALEHLDLANNNLTELPISFGQLSHLTSLNLSDNQLVQYPDALSNLKNLTELVLRNNQLNSLPASLTALTELTLLDLRGNPLPIPPEILERVDKPADILRYYFDQANAPKRPLHEAKVLLVGEPTVGKTSLVNRLVKGTYNLHEPKTPGIVVTHWPLTVNGQTIQLNLWDFAGHDITHATHQFFLTERSLYLLVLNARMSERENQLTYWLKLIQSFGGDAPIIVVGNWSDDHPLSIDREGLKRNYPNIKAFVETSCKAGTGIEHLKTEMAKQIAAMNPVNDLLPTAWFAVKEQLERTTKQYMQYLDYARICEAKGVTNPGDQQSLMRFLHDLGIVLNFPDDQRLEDTTILNPQWVTGGVYKILNSNLLFRNKGILDRDQLDEILADPAYPRNKHLFIIDIMRRFELCFDLDNLVDRKFLIPDLLEPQAPYTGDWQNALAFQYHYAILPRSIITRFIVRMHPYIYQNTYWRTGVVLEHGGNRAQVKADIDKGQIHILIDGPVTSRRAFLSIIRFAFDGINKPFGATMQPAEKVPLPDYPNVPPVDYQHLLNLERDGVTHWRPEGMNIEINVKQLLDGVVPEEERRATRYGTVPKQPTEFYSGRPALTQVTVKENGIVPSPVVAINGQEYPITLTAPFTPTDEDLQAWYFEQHPQYSSLKPAAARRAANNIKTYGEALFNQLFADRNAYAMYGAARQAGLSTVSFEVIGSPEFHRFHWEALRDPDLPQPLVLQTTLVRQNVKPQVIQAKARSSPTLNLLLVTARPQGIHDANYRTISRPLVQALRQTGRPIRISLLRPGTYEALVNHLVQVNDNHGPGYYHLLHFDVHGALLTFDQIEQGSAKGIYLRQLRFGRNELTSYPGLRAYLHLESDKAGQADLVEAQELAALLLTHQIPIVILNACQSAKQVGATDTSLGSYLMTAGVQTVLAMGYSVTVSAARLMMQMLYQQLLDGRPLTIAMRRARQELHNRKERRDALNQPFQLEDWLLPIVYQNSDVQLTLRDFTPEENASYYQEIATSYQPPASLYPFVGRDLEILQIERLLLTKRNVLWVQGEEKVGKTALLHHLGAWWQTTGLVQKVFYFSYREQSWSSQQLMEKIAHQLFDENAYSARFQALGQFSAQQAFLASQLRATPHLLLLDELDALTNATKQQELSHFIAELVDGKTYVLLSSRTEESWLAPAILSNNRFTLGPLDPEAAANLAGHILEHYNLTDQVDDPDFQQLLTHLAGHPHDLETVLPNLAHQTAAQLLTALPDS